MDGGMDGGMNGRWTVGGRWDGRWDGGMDGGMDGRKKIDNKEVKPDGMVTVSGQKRKIYCNLLLLLI